MAFFGLKMGGGAPKMGGFEAPKWGAEPKNRVFLRGNCPKMGIFGVKTGGEGLKLGICGIQMGGGCQKWPFLASKWGGGPKMGIWGLKLGGAPKLAFFEGENGPKSGFLGLKWGFWGSKLGGGSLKLGILGGQNGGVEPKMGFLEGKMP